MFANFQYSYEAIFRSIQYALVDNACREFLFISEYFMVQNQPALQLFNKIMGKTLHLLQVTRLPLVPVTFCCKYFCNLQKNIEQYISTCFDSIAIFLCFHLVLRYKIMCHKRCVPALDDYWDMMERVLLPRFEYILKLNISSIRDCDVTKFNLEKGPHYVSVGDFEFE